MTNRAAFAAYLIFAACQVLAISGAAAADMAGSTPSGTTNRVCTAETPRSWIARDSLGAGCRRVAAATPAVCVAPSGWQGLEEAAASRGDYPKS